MNKLTPLQIVVVRDPADPRTEIYVETLRQAFEGAVRGKSGVVNYLEDAIDLQIQVLDPPGLHMRGFDPKRLLGAARFTVVVVVSSKPKEEHKSSVQDLITGAGGESHVVPVKIPRAPTQGDRQVYNLPPNAIEPGLVPVVTALQAMELARQILQKAIHPRRRKPMPKLKFFVSHAKIDGVPMALSLLGLMRRMRSIDGSMKSSFPSLPM